MDKDFIDNIVTEVLKKIKMGNQIASIGFIGDKLQNVSEKYIITDICNADIIIISNMSLRLTSQMGSGCYVDDDCISIIKALFEGKKVYVLENSFEYKKYKNSAKKNIYSNFVEFEKNIYNLGIESIKDIDDLCCDIKTEDNFYEFKNSKILTENDIKDFVSKNIKIFSIPKKCIITPLAQDYIQSNNISVIRQEV